MNKGRQYAVAGSQGGTSPCGRSVDPSMLSGSIRCNRSAAHASTNRSRSPVDTALLDACGRRSETENSARLACSMQRHLNHGTLEGCADGVEGGTTKEPYDVTDTK